jgi:hypothetical protein
MDPYFVVTVSYIDEEFPALEEENPTWKMVTTTVAFRKIEGPHTAETFAALLQSVFEEYGIMQKVRFTPLFPWSPC